MFITILRAKITHTQNKSSEQFYAKIELDESYFCSRRKGKRDRGASGKVAVFGILKRGIKIYTQTIMDAKVNTLLRDKIESHSVVYTDNFRYYNALDVLEFKHYRINHSKLFNNKHNHINGIENFWNQAKRHMIKFFASLE